MFVAIEGIDGSGKTTFARALKDKLEMAGRRVRLTFEPTEGIVGALIKGAVERGIEPETEALLFMADRCEHVREIRGWLRDGYDVIADRYVYSTIAYQGERLRLKHGVEMEEWLWSLFRPFALWPDVVVLLDIEPAEGLARVSGRRTSREKFEELRFLEGVRARYLAMAEKHGFIVLDSCLSVEVLVEHLLENLLQDHSKR